MLTLICVTLNSELNTPCHDFPKEVQLSVLLTKNRERLDFEEERMRKSLKGYAGALKDIRETKCWHARGSDYTNFDDYCRRKLGFSEQRASRIIWRETPVECLQERAEEWNNLELAVPSRLSA